MRPHLNGIPAVLALTALAGAARGDMLYQTQDRFITAQTSFDQNVQTVTSPGLGPFVTNLDLSTTFPAPGGGTGTNAARIGIDCELDPNAIRVFGDILGQGGLAVIGTGTALQMAEARARVAVDFHLDAATPFTMLSTPRPSERPGDRFRIKLEDRTAHVVLFLLDESMPPQSVNLMSVFGAGDYSLEFEAEMTVDGPEASGQYNFSLTVPGPSGLAVFGLACVVAGRRRR